MMTSPNNLIAIYDFEFFPYALGDVLTWNIRTAMRCEEVGKALVDIYICIDERYPASIYQRGLVNPDNFELFFSELYGAFGTNPRLGNIFIFRNRESMLTQLQSVTVKDDHNLEAFQDYLKILKHGVAGSTIDKFFGKIENKVRTNNTVRKIYRRFVPESIKEVARNTISQEHILNNYFIKYIYSHESINQFFAERGEIPLLKPSLGCVPDVDEIIARKFKNKKLVPFHLRLRRLDVGYGGDHSYARDSDFLEWYDFLRAAGSKYPDVQFVALGRLQEKPLEILRLPNVSSLRIYGMGLGHELTFMLKSDLFIGSSSGFAALANFSNLPYFITKMNPGSCHAYAIPEGAEKLPFANENQKLIYAPETSALLMDLLEKGLPLHAERRESAAASTSSQINVNEWLVSHANPSFPARTTCRFYIDEKYRQEETAYLLLPYLESARQAFIAQDSNKARSILLQFSQNFPALCEKLPPYLLLQCALAAEAMNISMLKDHLEKLEGLVLDAASEETRKLFAEVASSSGEVVCSEASNWIANLKMQVGLVSFCEGSV